MSSQGDIVQNEPKMKRAKHDEREGRVDYISTMPNCILIYILAMLTTKEAVQTCILSKRWSNIWKYLPTLVASGTRFQKAEFFKSFVSKFLVHRDRSSILTNVDFEHDGFVHPRLWCKIINYAISHKVEQLKISSYLNIVAPPLLLFDGSKFPYLNLKYLNLSIRRCFGVALLPRVLEFPELIECHLKCVAFSPREDNGCAEPFSECKKLTTLSIEWCALHKAKSLVVVGDEITNLSIHFELYTDRLFRVQMRTPNLASFAYVGPLNSSVACLLFEHNLNFLEEARVEVSSCYPLTPTVAQILRSWLRKFNNVHSLTLTSSTLEILAALPGFPKTERVNLGNMMSLNVKLDPGESLPSYKVLNYLLQDSPSAAVTISPDLPSYYDDMDFLHESSLRAYVRRRNFAAVVDGGA